MYQAYYRSCVENAAKLRAYRKRYNESDNGRKARRSDISKIEAKVKTVEGRAAKMLHNAKYHGGGCHLTIEWIIGKLKAGKCEMTGLPFDLNGGPYGPSIDRIDSKKGYTEDNCRVIVWWLNRALYVWGDEVFRAVASAYISKQQ